MSNHKQKHPKIVYITIDPLEYRRRVINQIVVAGRLGFTTEVIAIGSPGADSVPVPSDCRVSAVRVPVQSGPLKFIWFNLILFFKLLVRQADIIHARSIWVLPALLPHRLLRNFILFYDANEYFSGLAVFEKRPLRKRLWLWFEKTMLPRIDEFITVSGPIADLYGQLYPGKGITVIRNLPGKTEPGKLEGVPQIPYPGKRIIMYHGYFLPDRGLENLIDAMAQVQDAILILVGEGPLAPELEARIRRRSLSDRIRIMPFVANDRLIPFISQAHIGISLLLPVSLNHRFALPNKVFEYIMAGVPVLVSNIPTLEEYIRDYQVGRVVDPADINGIARTLGEMLADDTQYKEWKINCRKAAEILNWENESRILEKLYRKYMT